MWHLKGVALVLCLLGLPSTEGSPGKLVYFKSKNLRSVLHWDRADGAGKVLYSVQYNVYGSPMHDHTECQNITVLFCDLTKEMNDNEYYYAKVTAGGKELNTSSRFNPFLETVLGAPALQVSATVNSINITVITPTGPDNKTSLEDIYGNLKYEVKINDTKVPRLKDNFKSIEIVSLKPDMKYCGSVVYMRESYQHTSDPSAFCIKTQKESPAPVDDIIILVAAAICISMIITFLFIFYSCYTKRKTLLPNSLNIRSAAPISSQKSPQECVCVHKLEVHQTKPCLFTISNVEMKPHARSGSTLPDSSTPYTCQAHPASTAPDSTCTSSTVYGLVLDLPTNADTEERGYRLDVLRCIDPPGGPEQKRCNDTDEETRADVVGQPFTYDPRHEPPPPADGCAVQLSLQMIQIDSQLEIHSLLPFLQPQPDSPDCGEETPLLLDITIEGEAKSDTGEQPRTKYLPSQFPCPPVYFQRPSGYRPCFQIPSTGSPTQDVVFVPSGSYRPNQLLTSLERLQADNSGFLKDWGLQIPEIIE
ncbi:interferon lambda receptor 1 [Amia ocellicauda]|uniref:interferon lambda receptor 1 n=1 Tax=Amia ocellicauda TaxID=2972642 RepID=UPI0034640B2E